ncbi:MAG TPA: 2-amino-4-hydroxy-6-hydroxymethyldihydropteridine diphosphokinase [Labilithrix sp.]|nr:2-amino-4-hydroxy-6-hydroxymethyldihydropteridine diphosphokinase [Labilithrix sp.]
MGLGANLGDRLATMRDAVARIAERAEVRARSHVYETAPVGKLDQPSFLNAAIAVECALSPLVLLDALLGIERELGRDRSEDAVRWGPRTIDLDVLWIEGLALDDARLVVPHPRLVERAFALVPLLEVAPAAKDPRTGQPYAAPTDDGVRRTEWTL